MKKLLIIVSAVILVFALSSCKSQQSCAAYGEVSKFQVDK
jgi:hypothetical protein